MFNGLVGLSFLPEKAQSLPDLNGAGTGLPPPVISPAKAGPALRPASETAQAAAAMKDLLRMRGSLFCSADAVIGVRAQPKPIPSRRPDGREPGAPLDTKHMGRPSPSSQCARSNSPCL